MKKSLLIPLVSALILTGAGCEADVSTEQNVSVSDSKVETSTTAETASESTSENKDEKKAEGTSSGSAATARPSSTQPTPAKTTSPAKPTTVSAGATATTDIKVVADDDAESDQDMIDIFEFKPTHARNYDAYKLWDRYAMRFSLDIVQAAPAAEIKYKPEFEAGLWEGDDEWCPLNQPCKAARDAQMTAYFAMIKADKAFKAKQTNTEQLVNTAVAAVARYYQTILAFEAAWGVKAE